MVERVEIMEGEATAYYSVTKSVYIRLFNSTIVNPTLRI